MERLHRWLDGLAVAVSAVLVGALVRVWAVRLTYPFDLEWMEGGILAHAWRILHLQPVYAPPSPEFVAFVYPPAYPALLAALGSVFGLSLPLGRAVSLLALAAATAALVVGVRRTGARWPVALGSAAAFLGTYPQSGAFYDLTRGDTLAIALAGWSVVLALGDGRRAPELAGLLLAAAIACKHNLAIFGLPVVLGLLIRDPSSALRYSLTAALPVLAGTAALQWASGGAFLTYLFEVPLSHPVHWEQGLLDTVREWGVALPVLLPLGALALVVAAARQLPPQRAWLVVIPVWAGIALGWWCTSGPAPGWTRLTFAAAWALAAGPIAVAVLAGVSLRAAVWGGTAISWRDLVVASLCAASGLAALYMRAHHGGYVNVHAPLFWAAALGGGVLLGRLTTPWLRLTATTALIAQLAWSGSRLHPAQLMPTQADHDAGWRLVDQIRAVDGPVLSPFAAWLPVLAGQDPSVHAMAVWDCNYRGGPYHHDLAAIEQALREHRWSVVLAGTQGFIPALSKHYRRDSALFAPTDRSLMPMTGWKARPEWVLVPRDPEW
ncbi:MAG: hypothetical protein ACI8PZ_004525 [Myxococcota bacterium]|jgi:hypothetical protein